jgi:hypothetical protein
MELHFNRIFAANSRTFAGQNGVPFGFAQIVE